MIPLGVIDFIWSLAIFAFVTIFAVTVRFRWISQRALLAFLLLKCLISLGVNLWSLLTFEDYDAVSYYMSGLTHAAMLSDLVSGKSTAFLTTTPFFWVDGISTDRLDSLTGVLLTLTDGSFIGATLLMCQIGAIGQLLIFRYLRHRFPEADYRYFYIILFHPSVMLWSASILKDTIGILALGLIIYHVNELLTRFRMIHFIAILVGIYLSFLYRAYTLVIIGGFILFAYWDRKLENPLQPQTRNLFKLCYIYLSTALLVAMLVYVLQNFGQDLIETQRQFDVGYATLGGGSTFVNVELSFSVGGLLAFPYGVANSLIRPYPWEIGKLNQMAAAVENIVMLAVVARGWIVYHFRLSEPGKSYARTIMYGGLLLTLICSAGVGLFSSNLGTISRYRIPTIPMFLAGPCVALALFSTERRRRMHLGPSRAFVSTGAQIQ